MLRSLNDAVGYTAVFATEVVMLLIALRLSFKLHIEQSAARREEQMVLQG